MSRDTRKCGLARGYFTSCAKPASALAFVKRIEDVRLEKSGCNVEKIECPSDRLRATMTRKGQSLLPNVGAKRCHTKHAGGSMLEKQAMARPSLAAHPFQHSGAPAYIIV